MQDSHDCSGLKYSNLGSLWFYSIAKFSISTPMQGEAPIERNLQATEIPSASSLRLQMCTLAFHIQGVAPHESSMISEYCTENYLGFVSAFVFNTA